MRPSSIFSTVRAHAYPITLAGILAVGVLLRAAPLSLNRFHEDEALYAYWGLQIATGADPMLNHYPVDKPPLFPYLLSLLFGAFGPSEIVARLPGLAASGISILLAAQIGRRVYGAPVALTAAAALALCPFDIAFAGTVFTDPLLVMWVLTALAAATRGRAACAGLLFGLAFETKQQAILFAPLIVAGFILFGERKHREPRGDAAAPGDAATLGVWLRIGRWFQVAWYRPAVRGLIGTIVGIAPAIWWDLTRTQSPGFLEQSLISYGGLSLSSWGELGERAGEWLDVLSLLTGSPALNWLLLTGYVGLLGVSIHYLRQGPCETERRRARFDLLLLLFALLFMLIHWIVRFNVWDRYLLGLAPLLALLAGRALTFPSRLARTYHTRVSLSTLNAAIAIAVLCVSLIGPGLVAARGDYPVGGDHGMYQGIDQTAEYLRQHVPANGVIHHRWLGWHYLYYMYADTHAFRWYRSTDELLMHVNEWPDVPHWMAIPEWRDRREVELALAGAGLRLEEMQVIQRPDGSISFRICRIVRLEQ
jgi:4-amino-4-deoxy-L-arabinose transferase-like glycosyltransferase